MASIKQWFHNARPTALPQSLMPAVLALVLVINQSDFNLICGLLAVIGVACAHLAMNLADDYFDYKVDMHSDRDRIIRKGFRAMSQKYVYLLNGSATLGSLRKVIALLVIGAVVCGAPVFIYRLLNQGFTGPEGCWWILAVVAATGVLGVFYSAPPLKLAYRGLGELVIGLIFGPLIMIGVAYSACGSVPSNIFWTSIPVGMLVLNILYTHSFVEIDSDAASNKMTFARLMPSRFWRMFVTYIVNLLPFAMVCGAVLTGRLHPAYVAVLLVLPRSIWLCSSLRRFSLGDYSLPSEPPKFLGKMRDWGPVKEKGIDWFLMRWLTARNTLSGFCGILIVVKIILLIFA